jgi:hypothetical protein
MRKLISTLTIGLFLTQSAMARSTRYAPQETSVSPAEARTIAEESLDLGIDHHVRTHLLGELKHAKPTVRIMKCAAFDQTGERFPIGG